MVIPRTPAFGEAEAWNHRYLFVDFSTSEEADRAVKTTNGRQAWGGKIRVRLAKAPASRKPDERDAWHREASSLAREHAFELDH